MNITLKIKHKIIWIMALLLSLGTMAQEPKLKSAFNGKNLKGWTVPENNIWWTVENGTLIAKSDPQKVGSILWTEKEYTDFIIQVDFRFDAGTVDSGIFIRNDKQQIQIGISGSLKRDMTASPYIAGKGYPIEAQNIKDILKAKDWNTMKVLATAGYYEVWLNNIHVMSYTSDSYIEKGPIGLQLHPNNEMTISFRNINIANIN